MVGQIIITMTMFMFTKSEIKKCEHFSYRPPCIEISSKKTADVFLRKQRKEPKVMYA